MKPIDRQKRIRFLRKAILVAVGAAIVIPVALCLVLGMRYKRAVEDLDRSREELTWYKNHYEAREASKAALSEEDAPGEGARAEETASLPEGGRGNGAAEAPADRAEAEEVDETWDGVRRVYLTFDDGPSASTDEILEILRDHGVKATFFVVGKPDRRYAELYDRIVTEGHTLAMHSYSHRYATLYESLDSFQEDLHRLQNFLYDTTGVWCKLYRFPGGSSNTASRVDMKELIGYLERENIRFFDWNVDGGDASGSIGAYQITDNVLRAIPKHNSSVVLLHDATDKGSTVEALPGIIEAIKAMEDTELLPITEDTKPLHHVVY